MIWIDDKEKEAVTIGQIIPALGCRFIEIVNDANEDILFWGFAKEEDLEEFKAAAVVDIKSQLIESRDGGLPVELMGIQMRVRKGRKIHYYD